MRVLRAHHINNLIEVVDTFLPREGASPLGGRPIVLHNNEVVGLLLFSSMVAPQHTLKDWSVRCRNQRDDGGRKPGDTKRTGRRLTGALFVDRDDRDPLPGRRILFGIE